MKYRRLRLTCGCGALAKKISGVGLSLAHDLIVEWRCPRCRRNVYIVKPISDCWRDCFADRPSTTPRSNADSMMETADDRKFLHSVGIKYSEE
jgi:hypothetical protein